MSLTWSGGRQGSLLAPDRLGQWTDGHHYALSRLNKNSSLLVPDRWRKEDHSWTLSLFSPARYHQKLRLTHNLLRHYPFREIRPHGGSVRIPSTFSRLHERVEEGYNYYSMYSSCLRGVESISVYMGKSLDYLFKWPRNSVLFTLRFHKTVKSAFLAFLSLLTQRSKHRNVLLRFTVILLLLCWETSRLPSISEHEH